MAGIVTALFTPKFRQWPAFMRAFSFIAQGFMTSLARHQYAQHKANAKKRGIEFKLTFEQWRDIWGDKLVQRGRRVGQLVMCRINDEGAYEVGNVFLGTPARNGASRRMAYENKAGKESKYAYRRASHTFQWNADETDEEFIARKQGYASRTVFA